MTPLSGPRDDEEHLGAVALGERDSLVVSLLRRGEERYVRPRVRRRPVRGVPQGRPGTQGLLVPLAALGGALRLVVEALERTAPPREPPDASE